jgi:FlaA1/EpsC-like NDP-sugar epimerase
LVTVAHPEITRSFMTISEAARLLLRALSTRRGGEILILNMGEPVRIVDLAHDLIRLFGFTEEQIRMVFTSLRPSEKLNEELLADDEMTTRTPHPKPRTALAREVPNHFLNELLPWLMQHRVSADDGVRRNLCRWVPKYQMAMRPKLANVSLLHVGSAT